MTRRYASWGMIVPAALILLILGLTLRPQSPGAAGRKPGDMGILVAELSPEACRAAGVPYGLLVVAVVPNGPADKKGIREGDVITKYENETARSAPEFMGAIRRSGEGTLMGITIMRDGNEHWLGLVLLGAMPPPPANQDDVDARFARLEDELDALTARVDSLEKSRMIPRRQVIAH